MKCWYFALSHIETQWEKEQGRSLTHTHTWINAVIIQNAEIIEYPEVTSLSYEMYFVIAIVTFSQYFANLRKIMYIWHVFMILWSLSITHYYPNFWLLPYLTSLFSVLTGVKIFVSFRDITAQTLDYYFAFTLVLKLSGSFFHIILLLQLFYCYFHFF